MSAPGPGAGRPPAARLHRGQLRAGVEQTLRRMRTDRLDLVQSEVHPSQPGRRRTNRPAAQGPPARGQGALHRHAGILSNLADQIAMGVFDAFQIPYSAVEREHEASITAAVTPAQARSSAAAPPGVPGGDKTVVGRSPGPGPRSANCHKSAMDGGLDEGDAHGIRAAFHPQPSRPRLPPSSAPLTRGTSPTTSPPPRRARCRPTSTPRPRSASRSRTPRAVPGEH